MMAAPAHAALEAVQGDLNLTGTDGVRLENNDVNDIGALLEANNTAVVTTDGVSLVRLTFDVDQSEPTQPDGQGIYDLTLNVTGSMGTNQSFTITADEAGNGNQILDVAQFNIMQGETLTFVFSGEGFTFGGFSPQYTINVFGNPQAEVPVPAAGLLFMTALGGLAAARRKRQAA